MSVLLELELELERAGLERGTAAYVAEERRRRVELCQERQAVENCPMCPAFDNCELAKQHLRDVRFGVPMERTNE